MNFNLNLNDTENNMLPQHSQKPFLLYKIFSKHISVGVRKNICRNDAVLFLDAQELQQFLEHIERKCLYISVYLRKKIFVPVK